MTNAAGRPSTPLPPGTQAPSFTAPVTPDQIKPEFDRLGASVIGISCDGVWWEVRP